MKIEQFKSQFRDFLRPNRYRVEFNLPATFSDSDFSEENAKSVGMLCKTATIPFYTFAKMEMWYNNFNHTFASHRDEDPVSLTFMVDSDAKVLKFFHKWANKVNGEDWIVDYFKNYAGMVIITLLDRAGKSIFETRLKNAYPTNLENIPLSYETDNAIMELTVSFSYEDALYKFFNPYINTTVE